MTETASTESVGELHDTYHAALQHEHAEPAEDALVLGVVAKPMYGIQNHIDRNNTSLAPPKPRLDVFKKLADEIGHNEAVDRLDFDEQYRAYLQNPAPQRAIRSLVHELESGRDVWLVCYENTDEKFCHRTILRDAIEKKLEEREST